MLFFKASLSGTWNILRKEIKTLCPTHLDEQLNWEEFYLRSWNFSQFLAADKLLDQELLSELWGQWLSFVCQFFITILWRGSSKKAENWKIALHGQAKIQQFCLNKNAKVQFISVELRKEDSIAHLVAFIYTNLPA